LGIAFYNVQCVEAEAAIINIKSDKHYRKGKHGEKNE
jgi:hypothetical protein